MLPALNHGCPALSLTQTNHSSRGTFNLFWNPNVELLLEGTDAAFTESGGVGLWTKADALTTFDNFEVIQ